MFSVWFFRFWSLRGICGKVDTSGVFGFLSSSNDFYFYCFIFYIEPYFFLYFDKNIFWTKSPYFIRFYSWIFRFIYFIFSSYFFLVSSYSIFSFQTFFAYFWTRFTALKDYILYLLTSFSFSFIIEYFFWCTSISFILNIVLFSSNFFFSSYSIIWFGIDDVCFSNISYFLSWEISWLLTLLIISRSIFFFFSS